MVALNPPFALQNRDDHSAAGDRLLVTSLVGVAGVVSIGDLKVTANSTPALQVQVSAGRAFINGTLNPQQGTYHCINDSPVTLNVEASSASLPRKDIVVAVVEDAYYSGAANAWSVKIIAGVPAAVPTVPVTPANAIVLAEVNVAASASVITNVNILDRRVYATSKLTTQVRSGPTSALPTTGQIIGQQWLATDTNQMLHWNGSAWTPSALTASDVLDLTPRFTRGTPTYGTYATRHPDDWVDIEGGFKMPANTSNPTTTAVVANEWCTIFTLPDGWKPSAAKPFASVALSAASMHVAGFHISTSGVVEVYVNNGGSGSTISSFSISMRYKAQRQ